MDIVVIGGSRWSEEVNQPPQQAVESLAKAHRVFYVYREQQSSVLRNLVQPVDERGRIAAAAAAIGRTRFERAGKSLWLAPLEGMPAIAPMAYPEWWRRCLVAWLRRWLQAEARRWEMEAPVYWFYWWFLPELAESAPGPTVYDAIDEHTAYARNSRFTRVNRRAEQLERRLLSAVDHAFAVSSSLVERKREANGDIILLPNGVSRDRATRALRSPERPPDVAGLPRPIVGYVGDVGDRLDWQLVEELVDRRPEWSFVLVGGERPAAVRERPNLHVLAARPYPEAVRCMREFDLAVLPLRLSEFNRSVSSLKLLDYLAAERRIVATDLPFVHDVADRWDGIVSIAAGADAWEGAIDRGLSEPELPAAPERRRQAVDARTVDRRVARVLAAVEGRSPPAS